MPTQTKSKPGKLPLKIPQRANSKIDPNKAIELRLKGNTYEDIAKHFNADKSNVHKLIHRYVPNIDDIELYKEQRADLFAAKQAELLFSTTAEDIKKMPVGSKITSMAILYDKERLERGQATEHIAYADMVAQDVANDNKIKEIQAKIDRLMAVEGSE